MHLTKVLALFFLLEDYKRLMI